PGSTDGPIISDVTEVSGSSPPSSPHTSPGGRCSPVILIKEEPLTPDSQETPESSPLPAEDDSLSPSTFIDSILQENDGSSQEAAPAEGGAGEQEPCLSVACLENVSSSRLMSEVSRLCSSPSLQSRTEPGNELNDHVDIIDSSLDSLQSMLSGHNFSMDTSAFMDLFSPSLTVPDLSLSDLDSSLASIQELLSSQDQKSSEAEGSAVGAGKVRCQDPPLDARILTYHYSVLSAGKQLVQYTAQPLILMNSPGSDIPILLELAQDEAGDHPEEPALPLLSWDSQNTSGDSGIS
ncbi:hypothetical protein GDO81_019251, partial [Engystomops pustulosus]